MQFRFPLLIILVIICSDISAQIFKYRVSGTSSMFISESGSAEIRHPQAGALEHPGSSDFSPEFRVGAEGEVMAPISPYFDVGLEFDFINHAGYTETAPLYNFFLTKYNPLSDSYPYPVEALIYRTKQYAFYGTTRLNLLPQIKTFNVFLKAFGGVAFTGTDFTFQDPFYRVEYEVGVLYAKGTRNSEDRKDASFSGGTGLGFTYRIMDKVDLYIDGTAVFTNSDIVDGVPNFNYKNIEGEESLDPASAWGSVAKISIGVVYSAIPDQRLHRSRYTKSRTTSKSTFWKRKRVNPFKRR
jgi:hypothetical protein